MIKYRSLFALLTAVLTLCAMHAISAEETGNSYPVVKSGCEYGYQPFCIVDKNGNADGFSVELLAAALHAMHRDVKYRTGSWTEIRQALKEGEIEALPLAGRTAEREKEFDFTFPYLSFRGALVVRDGTTDINGPGDLKGKDVAVSKGDNAEEFLRRNNFGCRIHTTLTFTDALRALSSGKYDAVVIQHLLAVKIIQDAGLTNLRIVEKPIDELQQDFCFAVKDGDKEMLSILNEGLALVMADGTFHRLQAKWFTGLNRLSGKKIVIAVEESLPPFSFIDNGKVTGFNVDLTHAVAEASGLNIEIVYQPLNIIRQRLKSGAIDAACGMVYSEDRDSIMDFSPPFAVISYTAFGRIGKPDIRTIDDLHGKKLICLRGGFMNDYIIKNHLTDSFTAVDNQSAVVRMLDSGNYDYALASKLPGLFWIKKLNLKNIKPTSPALITSNYCYAVNEGNTELLAKLNEGLAIVKQTGQYEQIYDRRLGVLEPRKNYASILKDAATILVPLLIILVCALILSWMLKRQVTQRTAQLNEEILDHKKTEEELRQSELKWKTLYTTLPVGVLLVDKYNNVIDSNPAFSEIHALYNNDLQKEDYKNRKYYRPDGTEIQPDEFPRVRAIKEQCIIKDVEIEVRIANEESIWAKVSAAPINLPGIACVVSTSDITLSKKAEEKLTKTSERLSLAASSARLGIWDWNLIDNSMTWDERMYELHGITRDTFRGTMDACINGLHPEDRQRAVDECSQAISGEKDFHTTYRVIHTNGKIIHIRADAVVIRDQSGKAIRMTGINLDITERIKTEEALQRTQKLESLGVLAGGIAHDFNNLLGGIYGFIDMAVECKDLNKVSECLNKAMGTIDRARGLTQQLLTFAKGGAPVKKIDRLVPFVQETARFALSGSKISCEFEIDDDLWVCEFDKNQIGQVIDNLVINAKQAMPDGGKIFISAKNVVIKGHAILPKGNYVKISIKDNGPGIPEEIQSRIFDPFFTTKPGGHGLGLSTSYSIINRHGGCIDVESRTGKGSTFHFCIPASSETDTLVTEDSSAVHKGTGTIILMDDEEVVREVIRVMLTSFGYSVICMRDGKEVIDYLKSGKDEKIEKIAAIIFDLTIPGGIGGKEAIGEVLKINSGIPVFVSSGYSDDPVMADPVKFGFKASICKPFRKTELAEMLNRNMG